MYNTLTGMSRFHLFPQGHGRLGIHFIFDYRIVFLRVFSIDCPCNIEPLATCLAWYFKCLTWQYPTVLRAGIELRVRAIVKKKTVSSCFSAMSCSKAATCTFWACASALPGTSCVFL
jgi:hypothetical protein